MSTITHTAADLDVTVGLDDALTLNLSVEDGSGNAIDVSAWTLEGDHCTPTIVDGPAGRIDLDMYSSTVGDWAWGLRRSSSPAKRLLRGTLTVTEAGSADTSSSLTLQITDAQVSVTVNETVSAGDYLAGPVLRSTSWYGPRPMTSSTVQHGEGLVTAVPIVTGVATIDRIACEITTAGESGAVMRLGIYTDDGGPDALLIDAGTVAADTTGVKLITVAVTVDVSQLLWAAAVAQDCPTTAPVARALAGSEPPLFAPMDAFNVSRTGLYITGENGALPDPWPSDNYAAKSYLVNVRAD